MGSNVEWKQSEGRGNRAIKYQTEFFFHINFFFSFVFSYSQAQALRPKTTIGGRFRKGVRRHRRVQACTWQTNDGRNTESTRLILSRSSTKWIPRRKMRLHRLSLRMRRGKPRKHPHPFFPLAWDSAARNAFPRPPTKIWFRGPLLGGEGGSDAGCRRVISRVLRHATGAPPVWPPRISSSNVFCVTTAHGCATLVVI